MTTTAALTDSMQKALSVAERNGAVFAGYNVEHGCRFSVAASTIRALEARGLVTVHISPDGGLMARVACDREEQ